MSKKKYNLNPDKPIIINGMEIPPKELWPTMDNEFVKDYRDGKIIYTKDFYVALYKKITEKKMTYVEAYKDLGFNISVLGTDRANAAGKRAMKMAEEGKLNTVDPSSYDGSVPQDLMGDMTPAEELAYLKARNAYLEEAYKLKKKFLSELAEKQLHSNKKKN